MRSYLNAEERALLDTFHSEGKKSLDEWFSVVTLDNIKYYGIAKRTHPRSTIYFYLKLFWPNCLEFQLMILYVYYGVGLPKLLQRVVHLYGATTKKVRDEILGAASSGTPSELHGVTLSTADRTDYMATSSAAPETRASAPPEVASAPTQDVTLIRPGSPLGRIRRGQPQSASPQAAEKSEGEEKSTDSTALVQKERKRAAGGDEEEIIKKTIRREHELPDDASSHPAQGGERNLLLSSDDENLERFLTGLDTIVISDDEVQEVAPPPETVEVAEHMVEVETETVASPPKQKKRRLRNGGKAVVATADDDEEGQGKKIVMAPEADPPAAPKSTRGKRKTGEKKSTKEKKLPSLEMPTNFLPTDSSAPTPSAPSQLKRSILSTNSMLMSMSKDQGERQATRVQWGSECMTTKDVEIAEKLTDVQLRQWLTQAYVQVACLFLGKLVVVLILSRRYNFFQD
ncbi:hypothetical protein Dimus_039008 [Dionaea muscipula]